MGLTRPFEAEQAFERLAMPYRAGVVSCAGLVVAMSACGDDDSRCPSGQRYSEKYRECYRPVCPGVSIFDEERETCRSPCPPGFEYYSPRRVCYACPDAAVGEWGHESSCSPPSNVDTWTVDAVDGGE
jgi:hypothetical protein